jgi:hypothetical protein
MLEVTMVIHAIFEDSTSDFDVFEPCGFGSVLDGLDTVMSSLIVISEPCL